MPELPLSADTVSGCYNIDVGLSLEKLLRDDESGLPKEIRLTSRLLIYADSKEIELPSDDEWPLSLFLKAVGFERIILRNPETAHFERWTKRLEEYQQSFIHDPEYLQIEELIWDEMDPDSEEAFIQCLRSTEKLSTSVEKKMASAQKGVPPLRAPLGVDERAVAAFRAEIDTQTDQDTFHRVQAILREFEVASERADAEEWSRLIADIVAVALETSQVEKAVQIARSHRESMELAWKDMARVEKIFAAYEPKGQDIERWAKVFESLSLTKLVQLLEHQLSSPAGPQIIKLMNLRAAQESEELIKICYETSSVVQKILLQWLAPYWKQKHYKELLSTVDRVTETTADMELVNYWIQALLRSHPGQALRDLKRYFVPTSRAHRFLQRIRNRKNNLSHQRPILNALAEHPTAEILSFLKEVRPFVTKDAADDVERLLSNYRGRLIT